jgi:hypothetical protein
MTDKIKNFSKEKLKKPELTDDNLLKINNQLEGAWGKFFQSDQKEELKAIDYTKDTRKSKAEVIFDARIKKNPTIIENIIVTDIEKETEIETTILNT